MGADGSAEFKGVSIAIPYSAAERGCPAPHSDDGNDIPAHAGADVRQSSGGKNAAVDGRKCAFCWKPLDAP